MLQFEPIDSGSKSVTLCEILDRVLNKGAVITGEVTISVAGVDLLYLGLQLVLTSVETGKQLLAEAEARDGISYDRTDKE